MWVVAFELSVLDTVVASIPMNIPEKAGSVRLISLVWSQVNECWFRNASPASADSRNPHRFCCITSPLDFSRKLLWTSPLKSFFDMKLTCP